MAEKLLSFQRISDDDQFDHDDGNIQEERIVNAKISLKEAHSFLDKEVDYFITPQTFNFFKRFNISTHFLHSEPDVWKEHLDFWKGQASQTFQCCKRHGRKRCQINSRLQ